MHETNCFLTLTFNDKHYPVSGSVDVRDVQLFMKRLRKAIGSVRFFACGEYGDDGNRPHYHVLIFGHDFSEDRVPWRVSESGFVIYRSATLEKVWPFGYSEIGTVTYESAGYVARYVTKKVTGEAAEEHYRRVHPLTGELVDVRPEFICMSNRPGIGRAWYDEYSGDCFPSDFLVVDARKVPVPRYFAKQLADDLKIGLVANRKARAFKHADNNTPERLETREESAKLKAARLVRDYEK